jgi:anti-sigma factor RsiW
MTCRKVRKLMPLFAGDDLGPRRTRAVRSHVEACPGCRRELEEFRKALARIKVAAKEEAVPDWSEGEWKALMVRATGEAPGSRKAERSAGARAAWPGWAAASAAGVLIGFVILSVLFRGPVSGPARTGSPDVPSALTDAGRAQDVVSLTMVSPETGLQIVWFLDKNFDYKGEQE